MSSNGSLTPFQRDAGPSLQELLREVVLTGIAVLVPAAISLYVLFIVFGFLAKLLTPVAIAMPGPTYIGQLLAGLALVALVLAVGFVAHFRTGKRAIDYFDAAMGRIPGLGAVYRSFRRMSDVMLDSDAEHFREVKLLAFPGIHAYMLGFVTTQTPDVVLDAADESAMQTLFVPLAPNPVMGGFVVHAPEQHVHEIDLTVEEGFRATVTSGVALSETELASGPIGGEPWELPGAARTIADEVEDLRDLQLADLQTTSLRSGEDLTLGDIRELDLTDLEDRLSRDQRARDTATEEPTDADEPAGP